jgi:hypothetical protein
MMPPGNRVVPKGKRGIQLAVAEGFVMYLI